jgi:hypothetical protein
MSTGFDPDTVQRLGDTYTTSVRPEHGGSSRGGCMKAVYTGLGVLFGDRVRFPGRVPQGGDAPHFFPPRLQLVVR